VNRRVGGETAKRIIIIIIIIIIFARVRADNGGVLGRSTTTPGRRVNRKRPGKVKRKPRARGPLSFRRRDFGAARPRRV